jgi:Domain of unknown function (DUF4276)
VIRVNVFVEGQTEETFVRELLYEYLQNCNVYLNPILVRTSSAGKGGVTSYKQIKRQLERKCLEDPSSFITTMFDLFRLPSDFPGMNILPRVTDPYQKATYLEQQMQIDISHSNFLSNLMVHEFEGLLYSSPQAFSGWFDADVVNQLLTERQQFLTPEHINDGAATAPSKRILRHCPNYEKPLHGALIAMDIGLDAIRKECQHFNDWLTKLTNLSKNL